MKPTGLVEQSIDLSAVVVRLIQPEERIRWDELMRAHHYLGLRVRARIVSHFRPCGNECVVPHRQNSVLA